MFLDQLTGLTKTLLIDPLVMPYFLESLLIFKLFFLKMLSMLLSSTTFFVFCFFVLFLPSTGFTLLISCSHFLLDDSRFWQAPWNESEFGVGAGWEGGIEGQSNPVHGSEWCLQVLRRVSGFQGSLLQTNRGHEPCGSHPSPRKPSEPGLVLAAIPGLGNRSWDCSQWKLQILQCGPRELHPRALQTLRGQWCSLPQKNLQVDNYIFGEHRSCFNMRKPGAAPLEWREGGGCWIRKVVPEGGFSQLVALEGAWGYFYLHFYITQGAWSTSLLGIRILQNHSTCLGELEMLSWM